MINILDMYACLELEAGAGTEEIRAAYRRLARECHPDFNPGQEDRFRDIVRAYKILADPDARRDYDLARKYSQTGLDDMDAFAAREYDVKPQDLMKFVKEIYKQGNLTRVKIKSNGEALLDLPFGAVTTVAALGLMLAPVATVIIGLGVRRSLQIEVTNKVVDAFERGRLAHESGDLDAARQAYVEAVEASEFFIPAHLSLGMLYRQLGENSKAAQSYGKVLEILPVGEIARLARKELQDIRGF